MKVFTYKHYIKCIHTLPLNAVMQLAEESMEYNLRQPEKSNSNHQLIKNTLENKKKIAEFINQFIEPRKKLKQDELIRYTNHYMIKKYKLKESVFIYKLRNQEIFFLIEEQSIIDDHIIYRMLNYCVGLMQQWHKNQKMGRNIQYPIIVPIIIYTGKQKWEMPKSQKTKLFNGYPLEDHKMNFEYNFIDLYRISNKKYLS